MIILLLFLLTTSANADYVDDLEGKAKAVQEARLQPHLASRNLNFEVRFLEEYLIEKGVNEEDRIAELNEWALENNKTVMMCEICKRVFSVGRDYWCIGVVTFNMQCIPCKIKYIQVGMPYEDADELERRIWNDWYFGRDNRNNA